jgi:hypothetical protein
VPFKAALRSLSSSDEALGPLRVLHPRKLDQDPVVTLAADIGLADAELVDAVADGFKRLPYGHVLEVSDFLLGHSHD